MKLKELFILIGLYFIVSGILGLIQYLSGLIEHTYTDIAAIFVQQLGNSLLEVLILLFIFRIFYEKDYGFVKYPQMASFLYYFGLCGCFFTILGVFIYSFLNFTPETKNWKFNEDKLFNYILVTDIMLFIFTLACYQVFYRKEYIKSTE